VSRLGLALALALSLCAGCIVSMGSSSTPTHPEERIPVPDKFKADHAPALVECEVEGCKRAPELDPNLYYCAKDGHWFRYALNRWYLAFAWDGNWFPTTKGDLPPSLVAITPAPEEVKKSREARLKELDQKLQKIDQEQSRDEKLKELDRKLEEIDKQQATQGGH